MTQAQLDLTIDHAIVDFARDLRLNKSPKTILTYTESARMFARFAERQQVLTIRQVSAHLVREWLTELRDAGRAPGTLFNRHSGLKALMRWAVEEGLIESNPVKDVPVPVPPVQPVPLLNTDALRRLLKAADGTSFEDVRDTAMLRLLIDTGMRRAECANLKVTDIDQDQDVAIVTGKGGRIRACPFGVRTSKALRRYLRIRETHEHSYQPDLWLGLRGPLQPRALLDVVRRRSQQAGLDGRTFVHQLRHTWAHEAMQRMNEGDVQRLGGWRDRDMLARYGASGADERARRAYREHSLGDRL